MDLVESEAKVPKTDLLAEEYRAKMISLDQYVKKLFELNKRLSDENLILKIHVIEKDIEIRGLKAQIAALQTKVQAWKEQEIELRKEMAKLESKEVMQKHIHIARSEKEELWREVQKQPSSAPFTLPKGSFARRVAVTDNKNKDTRNLKGDGR
mgnify:FL=1